MNLPFSLERDVVICATRQTVFRYFTESERWARWWGAGSRIDARPGGEMLIVYPGGSTAQGTVELVEPVERIVFTYGYDRPNTPIPPGGSKVTITLTEVRGGTRVVLRHDVATEAIRNEHVAGWRYQMSVFADVVTRELAEPAATTVDRYFAVWSERDAAARRATLAEICAEDIVYRDKYGNASGRDDFDGHIAAAQIHLPSQLEREGDIRFTLGAVLVDWQAKKDDQALAKGTTLIELAPDGRIQRVTGFWR
jgi:uncharacterized protein YndB with AHSA1/START domain